jgi:hypothetical protein
MDGEWWNTGLGGADGLESRLVHGTVVAYYPAEHTADVAPTAAPAALWPRVPVAHHCAGQLVRPGCQVALAVWPDASAVVLGPYGGRPAYPVSGMADDWGDVVFASTAYLPYANLSVELEVADRCCFWIAFLVGAHLEQVRANAWAARVYINDAMGHLPINPAQDVANFYTTHSMTYRTGNYEPGRYRFQPYFHTITPGDTLHVRAINLAVLALPVP